MRYLKRIQEVEKLLPTRKAESDLEIERICEWLAQHNEEFLECVRQLFRIQCKMNSLEVGGLMEAQYKEQAQVYIKNINELIEQTRLSKCL